MPIYEYACQACGENVEKLQKLADAPLTDCPACGESALKRKISAAGFRLSGGGWYETDFKSKDQRNLTGKNDSGSGSDKSSSGASKSTGGDGAAAKKDTAGAKKDAGSTGASSKGSNTSD